MTEQQFERYKEITEEINSLKEVLGYCSNRYIPDGMVLRKIRIYRKKIALGKRTVYGYDHVAISTELSDRIVNVIEQYVDEKKKELEEL